MLIWLTGFSGKKRKGGGGHAAIFEHLWEAFFPQQKGPYGLGLSIQPYRHALIWVTVNRFFSCILGCKDGQGKLTKQLSPQNFNNSFTWPRSEAKRFMNKCSCSLTVMMWWDSLALSRSCLECFWKSTMGNSWFSWIKPMQLCHAASINMME